MGAWRALMRYTRAAFFWRWNLLAFSAAVIAGVLSGQPDVVLSLTAAVELTYLGLLTANPRFRKAIDARSVSRKEAVDQKEVMARIREALDDSAWERFERLRLRCLSLDDIGKQFSGPNTAEDSTVANIQTGSLERLLWMFLKLLYSQDALDRFLDTTDRNGLVRAISNTEKDLKSAQDRQRSEKLISSIQDKLDTLKQRLINYDRAQENRDFLAVEIDRIEQKVNAISEMGLNARDPADFSAQVDGIAAGVSATEEAIKSLNVAPVFEREEAPPLLSE